VSANAAIKGFLFLVRRDEDQKKYERKWWFVVGVEYKVKFLTLFWWI
jgi:hypothetical protein